MLDEKDLQAIAQLLSGLEQRMDQKLTQQKQEILEESAASMRVMLESFVDPKFNLLADQLTGIQKRLDVLPDPDLMDKVQDELDLHHEMLKIHTDEIKRLKKAQ